MKKIMLDFLHRGLTACGFGPLILVALYRILQQQTAMEMLTVEQVCLGIVSLWALAFIAGGMNVVYQIERIPLMVAILIHGGVLYISYLITYLVNNWLERNTAPILVFTGIFVLGYLMIWLIIYFITRRNTERLNEMLKNQQRDADL